MKKVFEITQWDDSDLILTYFKSRLDWMPFGSGTKSYYVNWAQGHNRDWAKHRDNHPIVQELLPQLILQKEFFSLISTPITPIDFFGQMLTHASTCLVGTFLIETGVLTVEMEFNGSEDIVEALWGLSATRYIKNYPDLESILPEHDWWETNTPGHIGEMSTSVIYQYAPHRTGFVDKISLEPFKGKRAVFHIDFRNMSISTNFNGGFKTTNLLKRTPIYPILWSAVGKHQLGPRETISTKIYAVKFEV